MPESFAQRREGTRLQRWRRPLMRLRLFIALAFFGVVGWSYYYDYTTARALQEAEAEADRLDPGWGPEDIESKRAPIPDAANSAICVLKVAELLRASMSGDPANEKGSIQKQLGIQEEGVSGNPTS